VDGCKVPGSAKPKGKPRGGSRKGRPNKVTADLKAMIAQALDRAGGVEYLTKQAESSPAAFLTLLGKTLPKEVTGKDGDPLLPSVIRIVAGK
jgi:hypothetical protein